MELNFSVTNQRIKYTSNLYIVEKSRNYLTAKFSFSGKEWKNVAKTAIFKKGDAVYNVLLDEEGRCTVPHEVISSGVLKVSVFGGDLVTVDTAEVKIVKSGYEEGNAPSEPTPDVYAQILAELQSIRSDFVTEEMLGQAVEDWLAENVVEALSPEDVEKIVFGYMEEHKEEITGKDGVTFIPEISNDYVLSWNNDGGLNNPAPVQLPKPDTYVPLTRKIAGVDLQDDIPKEELQKALDLESIKHDLSIKNVATGENIHIADSKDDNVIELEVYGKSTQGENPSPENPQEVISSVVSEIKTHGKNFIPYPYDYATITSNGVTWTDLGDGRIMANGTATADSAYNCQNRQDTKTPFILPADTYILSGCPSGGTVNTYRLIAGRSNPSTGAYENFATDIGNGATFTNTEESETTQIQLMVKSGVTVNNLIFEPMLRLAEDSDATWEPYKESVAALSQPIELRRIEVTASDDYTYEKDGKYYVADTIEKIDGVYKKVQRIKRLVLDNAYANDNYAVDFSIKDNYTGFTVGISDMNTKGLPALCSHLTHTADWSYTPGEFRTRSGYTRVYLWFPTSMDSEATLDAWLKENLPYINYILAEPIITSLPTADQIALGNLKTFYPITNVSNNANAEMKVKYYADTKNYIDGKIATLEMALVNNI